jgi:translation initiation factor 2 beta subunit (eIF-2beta)/eIF-5
MILPRTYIMDMSTDTSMDVDLINVNGSVDPYYRYKMHPIKGVPIAKNGGTTVIFNAEQIAHEIYRELADLKSCFAKGTAGRVQIIGTSLHIPGTHDSESLQRILSRYINDNVLCQKCGNPETVTWKKKKRRCQACGKVQ